ncbi:hypothetical protein P6P90_16535 [Ectobacillus antri]|uniref:Uncharacterized protein n=1 Tax=Ectobacillus antri TaxID=2486280 RepID=A0ABT6H846_9BACI|nr:hypothetical protein [Ectobacillus antri]MDG5755504.1 hypothetical protein [Ectobacillus antri]
MFQRFAASKDRKQRRLLRLEIKQLTMSVSRWWVVGAGGKASAELSWRMLSHLGLEASCEKE